MASSFEKDWNKIRMINWYWYAIKAWITGEICHTIHWYAKTNNKYMKVYDKNEESSYLKYLDVNN